MLARLKLQALYPLYWLLFFTADRAVFLAGFAEQSTTLHGTTLLGAMWHGLRLDLSAAAYLSLVPICLLALTAVDSLRPWMIRLLLGYTAALTAVLSLLVAADLEIFRVWGRRIDAAVLPYLAHPAEVWASAGGGPRWLLLALAAALTLLFLLPAYRLGKPALHALPALHPAATAPLALSAALLIVPARGGFQLIPINQSAVWFSTERFANQAALNFAWNFADSWRRGLHRRANRYVAMSDAEARAILERARGGGLNHSSVLSTVRPNVLLIIWESFTARAVERLGGLRGVTPTVDSLAASGLLFRRFYAAGDRTEKGLAALLAGAPTIPDASILRVPAKTATLPIFSRDLASAGYASAFYYGGELTFGGIKGFAMEGGFGTIIGKGDFSRKERNTKWGANDGAVASRIRHDLSAMRVPFFVTWLTLSSHEPFDVPGPTRIPGGDPESRFLNSLAYTDRVLGEFLGWAESQPWWRRTLVVIVADHSKKLERTDAAQPYQSAESWYHIPMLWAGGALARRGEVVDAIGGQADFPPTLLRQLGLGSTGQYGFGRDLFAATAQPFAFYGFEGGFGLVSERGSFVWERDHGISSRTGAPSASDVELGRALLQLAVQDYLDR